MADNFFADDKQPQQEEPKPQPPVKIGEKEYSVEQIQQLVELENKKIELEKKYNTKLDRLMPEYTKVTQQNKELEKELEDLRAKQKGIEVQQQQQQVNQPNVYTNEQKQQIIQQAEELGLITKNNADKALDDLVQKRVNEMFAGRDLLGEVRQSIKTAKDNWGIDVTEQDVLEYMNQEGFKNPLKAIKDKFETEIDKIKEQKIRDSRASSYVTESSFRAKKTPPNPDFQDRDKVAEMLREGLIGEQ